MPYRFLKAHSNRDHLVVVVFGFRQRGTFDQSGRATESIECHVLWIEDNRSTFYKRQMKVLLQK